MALCLDLDADAAASSFAVQCILLCIELAGRYNPSESIRDDPFRLNTVNGNEHSEKDDRTFCSSSSDRPREAGIRAVAPSRSTVGEK